MISGFSHGNRGGRQVLPLHRAAPSWVFCALGVLALQLVSWQWPVVAAQQARDAGSSGRVRVKIDGFDLSRAGRSPNQAGTASRELPQGLESDIAPAPQPAAVSLRPPAPVASTPRETSSVILYAPPSASAYSLTPTFYWHADRPPSGYTFTLSSGQSGAPALYSARVTGGRFTYPADAPALTPGQSYVWAVVPADEPRGAAARATITILGGPERAVVLAEQLAFSPGPRSAGEAKIMFDARVWFDALDDYTRLIEADPRPEFYRQRSALYDQLPSTYPLADADLAKAAP